MSSNWDVYSRQGIDLASFATTVAFDTVKRGTRLSVCHSDLSFYIHHSHDVLSFMSVVAWLPPLLASPQVSSTMLCLVEALSWVLLLAQQSTQPSLWLNNSSSHQSICPNTSPQLLSWPRIVLSTSCPSYFPAAMRLVFPWPPSSLWSKESGRTRTAFRQ